MTGYGKSGCDNEGMQCDWMNPLRNSEKIMQGYVLRDESFAIVKFELK